jgi:hypothetical protein
MVSEPVLTHGLGFAMNFVEMIRFDYIVADLVDCVHVGNHGYRTPQRQTTGC